jgi:predicted transposase YdaD
MKYNTTLKELLQYGTPQLWQLLFGQQISESLPVELPSVKMRKPDFVAWLNNHVLAYVDLQSDNDETMEWRELEYYLLLTRLYKQPPFQYVIYFGAAPMTMRRSINHAMLQFSYNLIDIRVLNTNVLLGSESLADNVLAVFGVGLPQTEIIHRILEKFRALSQNEQRDWMAKLMILSGLRGAEDIVQEEAQKMGISTDIRDNKFFQEAFTLGIEQGVGQGIEQGFLQGEAKALRSLLVEKFGIIPEAIEQRLSSLNAAEIEAAIKRVLKADKIEDVFGEWQN